MKKILSLVLALMLMLGTTSAMALDMNQGMQMEMSIKLNSDAVNQLLENAGAFEMSDAPSKEMIASVFDLFSLFSMVAKIDDNAARMDLNLNQKSLVNMQLDVASDSSLSLTSNLLPNFAIVLDGRTVQMLSNQLTTRLSSMITGSPAQVLQAAEKLDKALMQAVAEEFAAMKTTTINSGNTAYVYEGVNFNYVEVKDLAVVDAVEALRKLSIRAIDLLDAFAKEAGINIPEMEELAELREELSTADVYENADAYSDIPIRMTEYKIQEGNGFKEGYSYLTAEIKMDGALYYITMAEYGKNMDVIACLGSGNYNSLMQIIMATSRGAQDAMYLEVKLAQGEQETDYDMTMNMVGGGMDVTAKMSTKTDAAGATNVQCDYYFMDSAAPLMSLYGKLAPLTEDIPAVDISSRTKLDALRLADGDMDYATQEALMNDIQSSASALLINAITAAPEQIQKLMTEVTTMMNQQNGGYYY